MRLYFRFEAEKLRVDFISRCDGNTGQMWSGILKTQTTAIRYGIQGSGGIRCTFS